MSAITPPSHLNAKSSLKLVLAPLRGLTDSLFRTVHSQIFGGFDYAVAPFITTVNAEKVARSHIRDILPQNNRHLPLVPQIIGNNPHHLRTLALCCAELGYTTVDWNLGCPFVKITRKHRGSGLIARPDLVAAGLDTLCAPGAPALSIKIRLGLEHPDQYLPILALCNDYPLVSVCIHGRTAQQLYAGSIDLDAFERGLQVTRHPVMYNGDICTVEQFDQLSARFGDRVSQWMIGRGAIADPLLALRICDRTVGTAVRQGGRIALFHDSLLEQAAQNLSGSAHLLGRMKELWRLLGPTLDPSHKRLKKVLKAHTLAEYSAAVEALFGALS